jgi:hypothetical protein
MAKKSTQTLRADIRKNVIVEKGGAWMLHLTVDEDGTTITEGYTAWANLSAAKRYLKEYVISFTPRKSIKMTVAATDKVTNKPIAVIGELVYKVEARA